MALNIEDKKQIVADVSEVAKKALSAVCADSCGIPVAQMTQLRKAARENNVYLHVVRNTLLARAVEGTEFECMKDQFKGPTLIGLSLEHPGAAANSRRGSGSPDVCHEGGCRWQARSYSGCFGRQAARGWRCCSSCRGLIPWCA